MRILLSCVGNRDPLNREDNSEGPLVTIFAETHPDVVFLFPTDRQPENREGTINHIDTVVAHLQSIAEVRGMHIETRIYPLSVEDPTDYHALLLEMRRVVALAQSEVHAENPEYIVNISSGTPQMQSCWLLLLNSGNLVAEPFQSIAPKYATQRTRVVDTTFLEEENIIQRVRELTRLFSYGFAAQELSRLTQFARYHERSRHASYLSILLEAYHAWDLLLYEEAQSKLDTCLVDVEKYPDLANYADLIRQQKRTLSILVNCQKRKQHQRSPEYGRDEMFTLLTDLYHSMMRRHEERRYGDALARFWRIYEEAIFYGLKAKGIDPVSFRNSPDKRRLQLIRQKLPNLRDDKLQLMDAERVLLAISVDFKQRLESVRIRRAGGNTLVLKDALDYLRVLRNESSVAHGLRFVNFEDSELATKSLLEVLAVFFHPRMQRESIQTEISEYSFGLLKMRTFLEEILTRLR